MVNIYLFLVDSFDNLPILVILVESFNKDGLFLPVLVVLVESLTTMVCFYLFSRSMSKVSTTLMNAVLSVLPKWFSMLQE